MCREWKVRTKMVEFEPRRYNQSLSEDLTIVRKQWKYGYMRGDKLPKIKALLKKVFNSMSKEEKSYEPDEVYNNDSMKEAFEDGKKDSFNNIRLWAIARNIIAGSSPAAQMLKMNEELGELAKAIGKSDPEQIKDGLGDCVVVLTIIAKQYGLNLEDCIDYAYSQIKDRTGKLVNGVWVKNL